MDRLVKPDVKEVELVFQKGETCSTTFKLTNLMHAMSVAVSLTTTNLNPSSSSSSSSSSPFSIDRPFSTIPPLSSSSYTLTLTLSHPSDHIPLLSTVTVRTSMLLAGKPHQDGDLRRLFSNPGPHVFQDAIIHVSLVGPHFAEFLISNHTQTRSLLNRAISGCTSSQLTSLLTHAVESGNADSVAVLIEASADANFKDSNGKSLVPLAIRGGNIDVVKILLASDCKIDDSVDFVLHEAVAMNRVDFIEFFLEFFGEANVNSVNHEGRNPIHVAALHGHVEVIRLCVSNGGDPNGADRRGWTPLHCAASEGHLKAVECLLECSEAKHVVDKEGKTAFVVAVEKGHMHLVGLLHWDDVLFRGARMDDVHGIKSCLAEGVGVCVNGRDQNGWTPLHWAAFKGRVKSVRLLLEYGAQVDAVEDDGYTPLRCAVEAGHLQVALLLISHGASATFKGVGAGVVSPLGFQFFGKQHRSLGINRKEECEL